MEVDNESEGSEMSQHYKSLSRIRSYVTNWDKVDECDPIFDPKLHERGKIYKLLRECYDLNYQIPGNSPVALHRPNFVGKTALHFAADTNCPSMLKSLLELGADFTLKNSEGHTALLSHVLSSYTHEDYASKSADIMEHPCINVLLDAQLKAGDARNPRRTGDGLSHLHVACMSNRADAVELFLKLGAVSVDERVDEDSQFAPGFTPLHFAAKHCSDAAVRVLLENGANRRLKNAQGLTPLQLVLGYKMKLVEGLLTGRKLTSNTLERLESLENTVEALTKDIRDLASPLDDSGLTYLHVACTRRTSGALEEKFIADNVHARVSQESPLCPGFTPLHFAAYFNPDAAALLLSRGADPLARCAKGTTPLDVCSTTCDLSDFSKIFRASATLGSVRLSDGVTRLMDVVEPMSSESSFDAFLSANVGICVPPDSPVWPGYNMLHLAVTLTRGVQYGSVPRNEGRASKRKLDEEFSPCDCCLKHGVDSTAPAADGSTPVHLAFRQRKRRVVRQLLEHHGEQELRSNPIDANGLSHFHIAAYEQCAAVVEKFLASGVDFEQRTKSALRCVSGDTEIALAEGSTALHIAIATATPRCQKDAKNVLLTDGRADPMARNATGLTPLLLVFLMGDHDCAAGILQRDPRVSNKSLAPKWGMFSFYLACYCNDVSAVDGFLRRKPYRARLNAPLTADLAGTADLNEWKMTAQRRRFWKGCLGNTPLHFAAMRKAKDAAVLLMDRGADIFARNDKGLTPVHVQLESCAACRGTSTDILNVFLAKLRSEDRQLAARKLDGLTPLHLACIALNVNAVEDLIKEDVDARVDESSPMFPGSTALHLLLRAKICDADRSNGETARTSLIQLALEHGADVCVRDKTGNSPIHVAYRCDHLQDRETILDLLLHCQRDHRDNPANSEGLSHFDVACSRNSQKIVEKFMRAASVNVNRTTDYFSSGTYAGFAPLDFAARYSKESRIVSLLLLNGAEADTRDSNDSTLLHQVLRRQSNLNRIKIILRSVNESSVNEQNVHGETPLEVLLKHAPTLYYDDFSPPAATRAATRNAASLLVQRGALLNVRNPVNHTGLLAKVAQQLCDGDKCWTKVLVEAELSGLDEDTGGNALHNVASARDISCERRERYAWMIGNLVEREIELEHRDFQGRTPLHTSVRYNNFAAICALLKLGTDVNLVDNSGKTAFEYLDVDNNSYLTRELVSQILRHMYNMNLFGFRINESNRVVCEKFDTEICELQPYDQSDLENLREYKMTRSALSVYDFLSERVVLDYPTTKKSERDDLDKFFKRKLQSSYPKFESLLNLQYRMCRVRLELLKTAKASIEMLAGLGLPDPCTEQVIGYLLNDDLRNLVKIYTEFRGSE